MCALKLVKGVLSRVESRQRDVCITFTIILLLQSDVPIQKLTFYTDKDAYFLWAKGNDASKTYVS